MHAPAVLNPHSRRSPADAAESAMLDRWRRDDLLFWFMSVVSPVNVGKSVHLVQSGKKHSFAAPVSNNSFEAKSETKC